MLELLKKILGFNNAEFDDVITTYIKACIKDLELLGVAPTFLDIDDLSDDLIKTAIITYVKYKVEGDEKMGDAYNFQRDEIRKRQEYRNV